MKRSRPIREAMRWISRKNSSPAAVQNSDQLSLISKTEKHPTWFPKNYWVIRWTLSMSSSSGSNRFPIYRYPISDHVPPLFLACVRLLLMSISSSPNMITFHHPHPRRQRKPKRLVDRKHPTPPYCHCYRHGRIEYDCSHISDRLWRRRRWGLRQKLNV